MNLINLEKETIQGQKDIDMLWIEAHSRKPPQVKPKRKASKQNNITTNSESIIMLI